MIRLRATIQGLLLACLLLGMMTACSDDASQNKRDGGTLTGDGATASSDGPMLPTCSTFGQGCTGNGDCCSNICGAKNTCDAEVSCVEATGSCNNGTECCTFNCVNNTCDGTQCKADTSSCGGNDECCSGNCDTNVCVTLNNSCKTLGNPCADTAECCSGYCRNGFCSTGSFCTLTGDACFQNTDCCSGGCDITTGTRGTCAEAPTGASFCAGGVDGTLCSGSCSECCSRLCAPYSDTGILICQPAQGCRTNGNTCTKDSDCCGYQGSGLPGEGQVTCERENPGDPVGICRNPTGCNPEGNVCHKKDYTCSISSARNACCGHPGDTSYCVLDPLGVPRCNTLQGDLCRKVGETCAFSGNCCDNHPCVADNQGVLRCGAAACVAAAGSCTITADCCVGLTCLTSPGSVQGTCGTVTSQCAQYGQGCADTADCCEGLFCNSAKVCVSLLR